MAGYRQRARRPRPGGQHQQHYGAASSVSSAVASYPGEDTRPTSPREILGWYMYSIATETYVICAVASFIPILLESLAHENGVLLSDHTTPCNAAPPDSSSSCVVYVFGFEVNTASFAMYTFSTSVLLQALLVVSISCAADHGNYRKTLLLVFAAIGSLAVMLFLTVSVHTYLLASLLAIVSNTSYGASFVLLNSFLPLLVRNHPGLSRSGVANVQSLAAADPASGTNALDTNDSNDSNDSRDTNGDHDSDSDDMENVNDSTAALLPPGPSQSVSPAVSASESTRNAPTRSPSSHSHNNSLSHEEQTSAQLTLSTQISGRGIGIGYATALLVQCIAIAIVFRMHNSILSQRVVLFVVGVWWAVFTIPTALWLRPRPGPPLPPSTYGALEGSVRKSSLQTLFRASITYLAYAWMSLFRTIALARRLRDIVFFLFGWFLLSDAIATTSSTAVLFAKTQLKMEVWALGLISVISTIMGVVGALGWPVLSRRVARLRGQPLNTILACLALFELIPLYGLLGYVPFVRSWGVFGLQQPWEMFVLAAVYGLVLGGLSSYCRSLYGELIPPGSEAAFYALYAITDKGSSVFGPAIVGAIIDASGEIRPAFWLLAVLVGLPGPLLYFVDVERGRREGEQLAAIIEGFRPGDEGDLGMGLATPPGDDGDNDSESANTPRAILSNYDDDDDDLHDNSRVYAGHGH